MPSQPKALRVVAEILSYVLHPVFFPLVMAFALYKLAPAGFMVAGDRQVMLWFISIGVTGVFFPLFAVFLMKQLDLINSYKMESTKERIIPLMASMIFYFWLSHVFNSIPSNPPLILKVLLLGNFWGIILVFLANIFVRISMHTAAAGSMVGIIIVLMMLSPVNMAVPLFVSLGIAGLIGSARMILGVHERGDIWLGYIVGISVQLGAYWYMK